MLINAAVHGSNWTTQLAAIMRDSSLVKLRKMWTESKGQSADQYSFLVEVIHQELN